MAYCGTIEKETGSTVKGHEGEGGWKDESPNPHDPAAPYPNHDSDQQWPEVLRLTRQGIDLLCKHKDAISKLDDKDRLKIAYNLLFSVTKKSPRGSDVLVLKGIHQRATAPHVTANVKDSTLKPSLTLHIYLSAKDGPTPGGEFAWDAVAVSAEENGTMMPDAAVVSLPARRGSITAAELKVLTNAKAKVAAGEAAARTPLQRQALSARIAVTEALTPAQQRMLEAFGI